MKQKLNNYIGAAVDDELFKQIWVISVAQNSSVAETLRKYLKIAFTRVYQAIPADKLTAILLEIKKIRGKK